MISTSEKRLFLKIIQTMKINFSEIYNDKNISDSVNIPLNEFEKLDINSIYYEKNYKNIATLAKIHILLCLLFQNKESVSNVLLAEKNILNKSYLDIILKGEEKEKKTLLETLETAYYHR